MAIGDVGAPLRPVAGIDQAANTPEPSVDMRWCLSSTSTQPVGCVSRSLIERLYGDWRRRCAAVASGRNRPGREHTRTKRRYAMESFEHEHEYEYEYEYEIQTGGRGLSRVCEPVVDRMTLWRLETLVRGCG